MIAVTGAAGFIGSCWTGRLNREGHEDLVLVDSFGQPAKARNLQGKVFREKIERERFPEWLAGSGDGVSTLWHFGARTDTTSRDAALLQQLNTEYSQKLWTICAEKGIDFIYASSAATYGGGEQGYRDEHGVVPLLRPLNEYGWSKQRFDMWALEQKSAPPFWAGLKFFNVFGPNEYHKGRMASVVYHAFLQIRERGFVSLFKSYKTDVPDGEQRRDFIYVMDVLDVCRHIGNADAPSGLYNVGSGRAHTFLDLVEPIFGALGVPVDIRFVEMPEDLRDRYQYYTCAEMGKMSAIGCPPGAALQDAVEEYVRGYLSPGLYA